MPCWPRAERDGLSHQQFLHLLIAEQANQRRERSIAHRIREARFRERKPLSDFDWEFNRAAIDRTQIEELATGASSNAGTIWSWSGKAASENRS